MTICVPAKEVREKALKMPVGYLDDCLAAVKRETAEGHWCFNRDDFYAIRRKYRGYAVSEADQFREGEIISGCCDRADQY